MLILIFVHYNVVYYREKINFAEILKKRLKTIYYVLDIRTCVKVGRCALACI